MSLEDEKQLYWQTNYVCPSSPVYTSEYDEAEEYAAVASMLKEDDSGILVQIMHPPINNTLSLIGGVHRNMTCAELLQFVRKLCHMIWVIWFMPTFLSGFSVPMAHAIPHLPQSKLHPLNKIE